MDSAARPADAPAGTGPFPAVALETSVRPASLALARGAEACDFVVLDDEHAHASDLVPALERLLGRNEIAADALELIVVGTGPGSYTGLRVGGATALGLRLGARAAVVGVPSFEAIAWRALDVGDEAVVLRNAFGGFVYGARYRRGERGLEVVDPPWCGPPGEAWERWSGVESWVIDPAGREALERALGSSCLERVLASDAPARADALLELGLLRHAACGDEGAAAVKPLYLRAFGQ